MDLTDTVPYPKERPLGDIVIRPFSRDGSPLADPLSIFQSRECAGAVCTVDSDGSIQLGDNLVVNSGRQIIANLLGGKDFSTSTSIKDWIVTKISFGTYDEVPRFTDTSLSPQPLQDLYVGGENEILYNGVSHKKLLSSVDWPSPFIVRFEAILGTEEANGLLIREAGLWTDNGTLFARKCFPAVSKSDSFALSWLWRVRT